MSVSIDIRGRDSFGEFGMSIHRACGVCGAEGGLVLRYRWPAKDLTLPEGVDPAKTILYQTWLAPDGSFLTRGQGGGSLGVTCGCYAKFHRQVAHICDSMARQHD